jgi:hypothetical protein
MPVLDKSGGEGLRHIARPQHANLHDNLPLIDG